MAPAHDKHSAALYRCGGLRRPWPRPVRLALLGATGSIGTQTLELVRRFPAELQLVAVSVRDRVGRLAELLAELAAALPAVEPPLVAVHDPVARAEAATWPGWRARLLSPGDEGLCTAAALPAVDCLVNALVGAVGLAPTLAAARAGKRIALANKESLVVGGDLVRVAVHEGGAEILPVDSEHSAIAQGLAGRAPEEIESLTLTASGGPFWNRSAASLAAVTVDDVLHHPTWRMGPKITVDSATLMNKGLEVIEAHHLFGLRYPDIAVVIHPGSLVHSLVTFRDGAVMAQLGIPDMRVPLLYALSGEKHWPLATERLNLIEVANLAFAAPDTARFPCLALARRAGETGGVAPVVLNAANEVAVASLLQGRLRFVELPVVIEKSLEAVPAGSLGNLEEALAVDREARRVAAGFIP
jgi:1-deoxy-D-xylulose-5-phosphate reductoisomerase